MSTQHAHLTSRVSLRLAKKPSAHGDGQGNGEGYATMTGIGNAMGG